MELHDMSRTKAEQKEHTTGPSLPEGEDYPYGLNINLEQESLKKLGLDADDFNIDSKVEIVCSGEINSIHESSSKENNHSSVSIQITKMALLVKPNENKITLKDVMSAVKGG